ncbi:hypothetical protein [Nocardioides campestrisoli]|nr:hypothetical protein [Nocardioides campestrisoli]
MFLPVLGALGFLDAHDARRAMGLAERFEEQRRNGTLPDVPTW